LWSFCRARNANTSSLDHYLSSDILPELLDDGRLRERPVVVLMVLPHILLALICEPLRASLIGGSNGNVDLNELLRELAL
jgi:hypothetical protein